MKQDTPTVLILEPVNHVLKVAEAAHEAGYQIVAIHTAPISTDAPYGMVTPHFAETIQIKAWNNAEEVTQAFEQLNSRYILVGTYTAAEITLLHESGFRSALGLPHNSVELLNQLLDKQVVRSALKEAGLSKFGFITEDETKKEGFSWPDNFAGYFKPRNGAGGAHVHRCENADQFAEALATWEAQKQVSFGPLQEYIYEDNQFFIEEEIQGELMSLEGYTFDGKFHPLGLTSRTTLQSDSSIETGACFPYPHSLYDQIVDKVKRIHQHLGVTHGATHTELIVTPDGDIELVELNCRFIGADMLLTINEAYTDNVAELLLQLALGVNPGEVSYQAPKVASLQYIIPPACESTFETIEFPKEQIVLTRTLRKPGDKLFRKDNQEGYIGAFICTDDNYEALATKLQDLRAQTKVNGKQIGLVEENLIFIG